MIICNGFIAIGEVQGPTIDEESGYAEETTTTWGRVTPCQWRALTRDYMMSDNGESIVLANYEIFVNGGYYCAHGEKVRLTDLQNRVLAEGAVRDVENLPLVGVTKITLPKQ